MNQVEQKQILNSIKTDNLVLFSNAIKNNESVSFGRFPVLSLCYLYGANKIIKKYKDILIKTKYYKFEEEPFELYKKFRTVAGRNLRLYLSDSSIVTPIEMLAILGRDSEVKRLFGFYADNKLITEKVSKNLGKIYTISYQQSKQNNRSIKISPKPLSKVQKTIYRIATAISCSFILLLCSAFLMINNTVGFGTALNPYKIHNSSQLYSALSSDGHYILTNDITLNDLPDDKNFAGVLNGNGHTLFIKSLPSESLISTNLGTIKNFNIEYESFNTSTNNSISLLVGENKGTIDKINITCESLTLQCNKTSNDTYITGFATHNAGTINNCDISLTTAITTTGSGDCYVNGIAGTNEGTISNCEYISGSIATTDADPAGICSTNELAGSIVNCKNHANISQTNEIDGWSPNVSGIVQTNYGTIRGCINKGDLTIVSNNVSETQANAFLGGITAINQGAQSYCLNKGNLSVTTEKIMIYCGGISGWSAHNESNVGIISQSITENCGTMGNINILLKSDTSYAFGGGLFGLLYGTSKNCYSLSEFVNEYTEEQAEKHFIGSLTGSAYVVYGFSTYVDISVQNNFVFNGNNASHHMGSLRAINYDGSVSIVQGKANLNQGISATTKESIKTKEVYWDE